VTPSKFIVLTQHNSNQQYFVNADKIIKVCRGERLDYTVVLLEGEKLTVTETPDDIRLRVGNAALRRSTENS
jgi:uncharacterized protein YlzI (FlbEa/FlbD family)